MIGFVFEVSVLSCSSDEHFSDKKLWNTVIVEIYARIANVPVHLVSIFTPPWKSWANHMPTLSMLIALAYMSSIYAKCLGEYFTIDTGSWGWYYCVFDVVNGFGFVVPILVHTSAWRVFDKTRSPNTMIICDGCLACQSTRGSCLSLHLYTTISRSAQPKGNRYPTRSMPRLTLYSWILSSLIFLHERVLAW